MTSNNKNNAKCENTDAMDASCAVAAISADLMTPAANGANEDAFKSFLEDLFLAKLEAKFEPTARHIANAIQIKHGLQCEGTFFFGAAPHFDKKESAAWGFITVTMPDGKYWRIAACGIEKKTLLCSFEDEDLLFDYLDLEEHLEEVADTLVRRAEKAFGLLQ